MRKNESKNKVLIGERIVFPEKGMVESENYSVPAEVEDNEVLIKTKATLISVGTEMNWLLGLAEPIKSGKLKYPIYPGYSNVGVIVSKGAGVQDLKNGDRIFSQLPHRSYSKIKSPFTVECEVPEGVSDDEAVFTTLAAVALYGVRRAHIELGENIVVVGLGVVGLLAQQFAQLAGGVNVIGIDTIEARLQLSEKLGARYALNAKEVKELENMVKGLFKGEGADTVFDATGNPDVINTALNLAGRNGKVVIVGSPHGATSFRPELSLCCGDKILIGAAQANNPLTKNQYHRWGQIEDRRLILELIKDKKLKVKELITDIVKAQEAKKMFKSLRVSRDKHLGIIIRW